MSTAFQGIHDYLTTQFEVPAEQVRPEATVRELDLDSLAMVELALLMEEKLGISVDELDPDSTLADLAALADPDDTSAGSEPTDSTGLPGTAEAVRDAGR